MRRTAFVLCLSVLPAAAVAQASGTTCPDHAAVPAQVEARLDGLANTILHPETVPADDPFAQVFALGAVPGLVMRVTAIAHGEPLFAPGEGWAYSSTGYILAGLVIEKVTGQSYGEALQERILDPLGMADTYVASGAIPDDLPRLYMLEQPGDVSDANLSQGWAAGGPGPRREGAGLLRPWRAGAGRAERNVAEPRQRHLGGPADEFRLQRRRLRQPSRASGA